MLERITTRDGVVFYRSSRMHRLGIPHGFSTRIGGVSDGVFSTLNFGNPNGAAEQDSPDHIATNYERLHVAIGAAGRRRLFVHQVHGDVVESATEGQPFDCNRKADAIVTTDPDTVAAMRTADCVPVLLTTADGTAVAAVHAGWRGVVGGVLPRTIERIRAASPLKDITLLAAIGPAISFNAFEVGPEVAKEFERVFGGDTVALIRPSATHDKAMIDLRGALLLQLLAAGVDHDAIDASDRCSYRDADEFFSHRRDDGVTGRMASLIGPSSHAHASRQTKVRLYAMTLFNG